MSLQLIPKRGLNPREVIALLMMVAAQLIIGVMMLQMMIANQGVNNIGVADVPSTVQSPFGGAHYGAQMNGGDYDGKNEKNCGRIVDWGNSGKDEKMKAFKMGRGIDASEYLLRTKQAISNRITCHRTFVTEKKDSLVKGLWEVIEGIYELEEMAAVVGTSEISTDAANARNSESQRVFSKEAANSGKEDREVVEFSQNPAYPAAEDNQLRAEISYMENRVTGFRKAVEEKMEKNDIEGVLNMVKKSLKGLGPNEQFKQGEKMDGNSEEQTAEKMKITQKSKDKVNRALSGLWEIFLDMEVEMKDTELWLRNTELTLKGAVNEFAMGWKL